MNHFNHERHLQNRQTYKQKRTTALTEWFQICASQVYAIRGALRRVRLCLTTPLRAHFDRYCVMNRRRLCTVSDLCEVTWTALTCLAIVYRMLRSRIPKAVHGTLCCPVLVWWSLTSTFQKREAWKRCSANCCTNVTQVEISPL